MTIVVTGAAGQLGRELVRLLDAQAWPLDLPEHDLTDFEAIRRLLGRLRPHAVVNCAAYVHVDDAELEPRRCFRVNSLAVANLVDACRRIDARLVQISTDYVFGGGTLANRPYRETDLPSPDGVYARSKFEAEVHVANWANHTIVRSCGLYARRDAPNGSRNFVKTILRFAAGDRPLRVVNDQHCTPTYVPHLAKAICYLLSTEMTGLFHVTNSGATTWFEFAREIVRLAGLNVHVTPCTTVEYGVRAPRPTYSVLDTTKYHGLGGPAMPEWRDALREYFAT
jgi:dTDP-4-dehydrorhamnose reductase